MSAATDKAVEWFSTEGPKVMRHKMPAHEFVRALPWWMIREAGEDDGALCFELALFCLWLWGLAEETVVDGLLALRMPSDRVERAVDAMRTLLAMEELRRLGVHRFSVSGDGSLLDASATVTIEINPVVSLDPKESREEKIRAALATDWADPGVKP